MANVLDHSTLRGEVFLVNSRRNEVRGKRAYDSVRDLPGTPDVAVIALAADLVPDVVRDCAAKGIPFAVVLSSGFSEAGEEGQIIERELRRVVDETGIRLYGPNCPGISNIKERIGLNFSPAFAADLNAGAIGLATQGGGLGRTLLQAMQRGIGVAQFLSAGNEADLEISDFIHHLADAPDVRVIAVIIEGIRDGERFIEAALHARRMNKPIVAIKLGRSEYGKQAAMSHTTSMTGEADVNSAVFKQLGIVEVEDLDELIDTAALFAQRLPGPDESAAIYTYSGGTAALAADMIGASGLKLTTFQSETVIAIKEALPRFGTHSNPVDTGTEVLSNPPMIRASIEPILRDPGVGVTLVPVPIEMGETTAELARAVVELKKSTGATILPVWMTDRLGEGYRIFADNGLVSARSLKNGVSAIAKWAAAGTARAHAELDWEPPHGEHPDAFTSETDSFSEVEAKARLQLAGIEVPNGQICATAADAVEATERIGFPVALKIVSPDVLHKSDAGGVRLFIASPDEVAEAFESILTAVAAHVPHARIEGVLVEQMITESGYEAILGIHRDPVFGAMITFGAGGVLVELVRDAARQLLPLTEASARRLVGETMLGTLLRGQRGKPAADISELVRNLVRISDFFIAHCTDISEMEINPLWISNTGEKVIALDSLIVERKRR